MTGPGPAGPVAAGPEWVRSNRRVNGADYDDPNAARRLGPWHVVQPIGWGATYCGRTVRGVAADRWVKESAPEGRVCGECVERLAADKPRSVGRR